MTTSGMGAVTPTDVKNILEELNKNLGLPDNSKVTSTPVLCKDGTTKSQTNDPNAKVLDACRNNGGRAENQTFSNVQAQVPTKTGVSIYRKLAGAYNKNLIIALVLVAGYFAYKKFKK
jgi:hypothetical protein